MARSAPPDTDDARARLRALGGGGRAGGWGGRDAVEVGAPADPGPSGGARVGWPGAPPGTPAARLRLPPPAPARDDPPVAAPDDPWWDDEDDPVPAARRGSAWDPPERGERARRWVTRWLPSSWIGARWDPGRTGALALAAVAAVAAVVAAVGVWSDRPVAEPVPALPLVAGAPVQPSPLPALPGGPAPPDTGPIVVSVSGKVARPGLVRLPPGSRVGEAIDAAGGASPEADLTGLNLAARLSDGEQVVVGVPAAAVPAAPAAPAAGAAGAAPAGGAGGAAPGGPVNLNTATLEQLDQLPGVGPVTAQRILEWRTQNGRFGAVEQLQEVSGIGDARFATLRDLVTV
ncbi:helix-hairpin-helix domain-containing protein [Actinomycetospora rhizophila]|uniref:Helix-hairpin-helix domain-containing protein n=1 Tax=Actinomycetospora rhizophila TaxID=1416876 RepID=A0ABV9ZK25_9PSEU